jgi:opacity protein-like surface antigen
MKKLTLLLLALTPVLSLRAGTDMKEMVPPAVAPTPSDGGFYVAAAAGAFASDASVNHPYTFDTYVKHCCRTYAVPHHGSYSTSSDWGPIASLEGGYNFNSFPAGMLPFSLQAGIQIQGVYKSNNNYDAWAGLVNGTLAFKNDSIVTPYIGIGGGFEYLSGYETGLHGAIDGEFGLQERIDRHWSVFEQYQCIDVLADTSVLQHNIEVGVAYNF